MTRLLLYSLPAVLAIHAQEAVLFELRHGPSIDDGEWSAPARRLRAEEGASWYYASAPGFLICSDSLQPVARAVGEFNATERYFRDALDLKPPDRQALIFLRAREDGWHALGDSLGLRRDGYSFQTGRELFIGLHGDATDGRVAHEAAHYRIRSVFGDSLPLWLEEGLALYWGWEALHAYPVSGLSSRKLEPVIPERLQPWRESSRAKRYPGDTSDVRAFYRQAEEAIRLVAERSGQVGLVAIVRAVSSGRTLEEALAGQGWKPEDVLMWEKEMQVRCLETRVTP